MIGTDHHNHHQATKNDREMIVMIEAEVQRNTSEYNNYIYNFHLLLIIILNVIIKLFVLFDQLGNSEVMNHLSCMNDGKIWRTDTMILNYILCCNENG